MSVITKDAGSPLTLHDPGYFERLARVEFEHWWPAGMWQIVAHWLNRSLRGRSNLRALDVGCGTGGSLVRLEARPEIAIAIGVDASPTALALARQRSGRLLCADAFSLPFADGSFDVVTCFDVWQHLRPEVVVPAALEIHRVLRPGGLAVIRANGRGLWPSRRLGARLYRVRDLVDPIEAAGLRVERATYANCLPSIAQEILGRLRPASNPNRPAHPAGAGLCLRVPPLWLNRFMGRISSCEAFAAGRLGIPLPVGHSTLALALKVANVGLRASPTWSNIEPLGLTTIGQKRGAHGDRD